MPKPDPGSGRPSRIKVFLVTGFLGAGKTTLVKRILQTGRDLSRTIVLVNEFGKVGVDGSLIRRTAAADVVELSSGCICCSLKTDMIQALRMLKHDYSPERILIEATGVADPAAIIDVLKAPLLSGDFLLEKTVTVLDADFWEAREGFGTVFDNQLALADLILLNKVDTLDPSDITSVLAEIREVSPGALVIPSFHCNIDPDLIWDGAAKHRPGQESPDMTSPELTSLFEYYDPKKEACAERPSGSADAGGFKTFGFKSGLPMDETAFNRFLESVPFELFRIKGPVKFPDQTRILNFVGGNAQWEPWRDTTDTHLAFIGWEVGEERVLRQVEACLL